MKVLVYGTLKRNKSNHDVLEGSTLVQSGEFEINNCQLRVGSPYSFPFLYFKSGMDAAPFIGEIYEVNSDVLTNLDHLEGHPSFYERVFIKELDCYTYLFKHDDIDEFETIGDF